MNKIISAIIGIAVAAAAGYFVYEMTMSDDSMMKSDDAMMKSEDTMMKSEDSMMKSEDSMMKSDDAMMKSEDSMMKDDSAMMKTEAVYTAYTDGVIGNGKTSVLFFHAPWCPNCRAADKDLASIYGAGGASINTYKVDYDTQTELKKKYGVTYQHTFVVIDGQGNAVKTMMGATATQLAALVK